jgi:hypothetical protein
MPKPITSPKRKKKMVSKSRIKPGSKEAKEWNLKMQEIKRKKREERNRKEEKEERRRRKMLSPKKEKRKGKKERKGKKKMESFPFTHGTLPVI